MKINIYLRESQRIASTIFPEVLEENKKLGIPTPIGIGGRIYFIMPDERIVREEELEKEKKAGGIESRGPDRLKG